MYRHKAANTCAGANFTKGENPILAAQRLMNVVDITVTAVQDDLAIVSTCFNPQVHMRTTCSQYGKKKQVRSDSGSAQYA